MPFENSKGYRRLKDGHKLTRGGTEAFNGVLGGLRMRNSLPIAIPLFIDGKSSKITSFEAMLSRNPASISLRRFMAFGIAIIIWSQAELAAAQSKRTRVVPMLPPAEGQGESEASVTPLAKRQISRQIGVFYRLDLKRHNMHAPTIAAALRSSDDSVRSCYIDRLEVQPRLSGRMVFSFRLSETRSHMDQISHLSGSMRDTKLAACIRDKLANLNFRVPGEMRGTLTYQFSVRETIVDQSLASVEPW